MKKLIQAFDIALIFIAIFNLLLILIIPSDSDVLAWRINYFYTFGSIIILLFRIILDLSVHQYSSFSFRKNSVDIISILVGMYFLQYSLKFFQFYILIREAIIMIQKYTNKNLQNDHLKNLFKYPALWIIFSFFLAIIMGSFALMLPGMTKSGLQLSYIDALFTSTSAICVTGLNSVDTITTYSVYGQLVIIFLIQIGGLGIMTISSALALAMGQKFSLKSGALIQNVLAGDVGINFSQLIKNIILFTFTFEFIGSLLLFIPFYSRFENVFEAYYNACFHSVSAFCNAGFALFSDNLMSFKSDIIVNLTICGLIIVGGIGFFVIDDTKKIFNKRFKFSHLKLHSKVVLVTTVCLLLVGALFFFITEYSNTMSNFNIKDKILGSFFLSTTCRTAGFNTIDMSRISFSSVLICLFLMYVGASPGSTGGGIKTTTFAVIMLSVFSILKGSKDVTLFNRKISDELMMKVLALLAMSVMFIFFIVLFLLAVEPFSFEKIVFEAISAFGTVGLSMGITPFLSSFGKLLIISLMFIGRVGPLTFVFAFAENVIPLKYAVPVENVDIG